MTLHTRAITETRKPSTSVAIAAPQTSPTLHHIDDEPRILDTDLAVKLGFARPAKVRELIDRHHEELSTYGFIPTVGINAGQRGRPAKAFYLNEEQALLICMFANTDNAKAARAEIIAVFKAYRRGNLVPAAVPAIPDFSDPAEAAEAWAREFRAKRIATERAEQLAIENQKAAEVIEEMRPMVNVAKAVTSFERTVLQVARVLTGVHLGKIKECLFEMGFFYKKKEVYHAYRNEHGFFYDSFDPRTGAKDIFCTKMGMVKLVALYRAGALPMKDGCRPSLHIKSLS